MSDYSFGSKYTFCDKCPYRNEVDRAISCPSRFDPYDKELCPRHDKFMQFEQRARIGKMKKTK